MALAEHHRGLAQDLVPPARERPLVIRGARLWEPTPGVLMEFTGSFFNEELDATWEIVAGSGRLLLRRWGMPDQLLEPLLPDMWMFEGSTEPRLQLERDAAETVTALSLANSQILGMTFVRSER